MCHCLTEASGYRKSSANHLSPYSVEKGRASRKAPGKWRCSPQSASSAGQPRNRSYRLDAGGWRPCGIQCGKHRCLLVGVSWRTMCGCLILGRVIITTSTEVFLQWPVRRRWSRQVSIVLCSVMGIAVVDSYTVGAIGLCLRAGEVLIVRGPFVQAFRMLRHDVCARIRKQ